MAVILIIYTLALLSPPPSPRDTSASGGHEMAIYPIATQSRMPGWAGRNDNIVSFMEPGKVSTVRLVNFGKRNGLILKREIIFLEKISD